MLSQMMGVGIWFLVLHPNVCQEGFLDNQSMIINYYQSKEVCLIKKEYFEQIDPTYSFSCVQIHQYEV